MGSQTGFSRRLAQLALGEPDRPLVFLGNFEVEEEWARGECTLPRISSAGHAVVVNRMDEFALLLGGTGDHVVLKGAPDPDHLEHLAALGLPLPTVHVAAGADPRRKVTADALADPGLLARLAGLGAAGAHLAAHGISPLEEEFARQAGLPLLGPGAALSKQVNSKVYSRRAADELGLRQAEGWSSETPQELEQALDAAARVVRDGGTVAVKEAFGVSGKGISVVDRPARLDRLRRMLATRLESGGGQRACFVIERWLDKLEDLNYQFTVSREGSVHFDFVKTAVTEGGVHKGHRFPARLSGAHLAEVEQAAEALGKRLAADGYVGVVGVDALIDAEDVLYPVIEINARFNMSTYQLPLQEHLIGFEQLALAKHYPLRLTSARPFAELGTLLDGLLLRRPGGNGLVVSNYATVNAGAGRDRETEAFDGRLYGLVIADSQARLNALDSAVADRLAGWPAQASGSLPQSTSSTPEA